MLKTPEINRVPGNKIAYPENRSRTGGPVGNPIHPLVGNPTDDPETWTVIPADLPDYEMSPSDKIIEHLMQMEMWTEFTMPEKWKTAMQDGEGLSKWDYFLKVVTWFIESHVSERLYGFIIELSAVGLVRKTRHVILKKN